VVVAVVVVAVVMVVQVVVAVGADAGLSAERSYYCLKAEKMKVLWLRVVLPRALPLSSFILLLFRLSLSPMMTRPKQRQPNTRTHFLNEDDG